MLLLVTSPQNVRHFLCKQRTERLPRERREQKKEVPALRGKLQFRTQVLRATTLSALEIPYPLPAKNMLK